MSSQKKIPISVAQKRKTEASDDEDDDRKRAATGSAVGQVGESLLGNKEDQEESSTDVEEDESGEDEVWDQEELDREEREESYTVAKKVMDCFFDILKETEGVEYVARVEIWNTTAKEEKHIDELCKLSRALRGPCNDVGVSPVMQRMVFGYLRSQGFSDDHIPRLCKLATKRQVQYGKNSRSLKKCKRLVAHCSLLARLGAPFKVAVQTNFGKTRPGVLVVQAVVDKAEAAISQQIREQYGTLHSKCDLLGVTVAEFPEEAAVEEQYRFLLGMGSKIMDRVMEVAAELRECVVSLGLAVKLQGPVEEELPVDTYDRSTGTILKVCRLMVEELDQYCILRKLARAELCGDTTDWSAMYSFYRTQYERKLSIGGKRKSNLGKCFADHCKTTYVSSKSNPVVADPPAEVAPVAGDTAGSSGGGSVVLSFDDLMVRNEARKGKEKK